MAIYTPSPAVKKTKIRYAGSKQPVGHPPAVGKTLVKPKPKPRVVTRRPVANPLTRLYNQYQSSVLSEDEMQQKATDWVNSQLNPSTDLIKQAAERQRTEAAQRRDAMTAAYMAAANANQGMGAQINQGFQSAASTLGGLAGAATGQVGAAMRADIAAQNQALANVGQAATSTGDPAQQQGVENYTSGYLPATNLAQLGAISQAGFLGAVADQRMRAVQQPWGEYSDTISSLNEQELSDLQDISMKRPDLVESVLDKLRANSEKAQAGISDIEELRYKQRNEILDRREKERKARADLKYKYATLRQRATTDADKRALDRWYKGENLRIDQYAADTSRMNAQTSQQNAITSQGRLAVSKYNAKTSRINANNRASGKSDLKSVAEVVASAGRSHRDVPAGTPKPGQSQRLANSLERNKIRDALFEQYKLSVPRAQWPALKAQLTRWVYKLPIQQKRSGGQGALANALAGLPKG
jgi:hypothetical protein